MQCLALPRPSRGHDTFCGKHGKLAAAAQSNSGRSMAKGNKASGSNCCCRCCCSCCCCPNNKARGQQQPGHFGQGLTDANGDCPTPTLTPTATATPNGNCDCDCNCYSDCLASRECVALVPCSSWL